MKQVNAILIGAGLRGAEAYSSYALKYPNELKIVAVAEPDDKRRKMFQEEHGISQDKAFADWEDVLNQAIEADCVMVCTQDRMHLEPVTKALSKGYHVLCEKPMSPLKDEIIQMGQMAEKYDRLLIICHVLRYSPFFTKLKKLLQEGKIGRLISIQHMESVGYWHQAHSFVRGNWRNSKESSPMILQKCCHDMDILLWLTESKCVRVSSFGELTYFKEENAPLNAPAYCLDGCEHRDTCPYYAPRFYLNHPRGNGFLKAVSADTSKTKVLEALAKGPYGRCVFHSDNDVVDHQVVNLEFESGVDVSFSMCAFTNECERVITLMGTAGQIKGNMEKGVIVCTEFITGTTETIQLNTDVEGHSGSDTMLMKEFVRQIAEENKKEVKTSAAISVESHLMALAVEESRKTGQVVKMEEFTG